MILLDVYPAKIETPDRGVVERVRAVVDGGTPSRLLLFAEGPPPSLVETIPLPPADSTLPLRGNAVVVDDVDGAQWRIIRTTGGGCCGSPGARLRTFPIAGLLALAPAE